MKKLNFILVSTIFTVALWAQAPSTIGPNYQRTAQQYTSEEQKTFVNSAVFFKLEAIDNETGLQHVEFTLDGKNFMLYQQPFQLLTEGPQEISYRSFDNSGNLELVHTKKIIVDNTTPTVKLDTDQPLYVRGLTRYCSPRTRWFVRATDNAGGAGVANRYIGTTIDSMEAGTDTEEEEYSYSLAVEGPNELYYTALDNVGNLAPISLLSVIVDATPPVVYIENSNRLIRKDSEYTVFPSDNVVDNSGRIIVSSNEAVAFGATDESSGVESIYIKINDGEYHKYIDPIKFSVEDIYNIEVKAIDNVGNESEPVQYTFFVDKIDPSSILKMVDESGRELVPTEAPTETETSTPEPEL